MMRPPPIPPYWPAYPEPERSRLEAAYRKEHEAYCAEIDRHFILDIIAVAMGIALSIAIVWLAT